VAPFFLQYSYHSYQPGLPLLPLQDATLDRNLFNSTKHFSTQKTVEEKTKTMANIDRIHQISEFDPTTINFGHPSATSYCSDAEISTYTTESAAVPKQRYTSTYCSDAEISTILQRAQLSQSSAIQILTVVMLK
jgi:hypothetical protein